MKSSVAVRPRALRRTQEDPVVQYVLDDVVTVSVQGNRGRRVELVQSGAGNARARHSQASTTWTELWAQLDAVIQGVSDQIIRGGTEEK